MYLYCLYNTPINTCQKIKISRLPYLNMNSGLEKTCKHPLSLISYRFIGLLLLLLKLYGLGLP